MLNFDNPMNKKIALVDVKSVRDNLLPLTFTRPVALLRTGIGTIADHWQRLLSDASFSFVTEEYLAPKFPADPSAQVFVAAHVIPSADLAEAVSKLADGQWIANEQGEPIAWVSTTDGNPVLTLPVTEIRQPYHLFTLSKELITKDFEEVTAGRVSQPIPESCTVIGDPDLVFIGKGADVEGCFLNTRQGPIYIADDAEVQEACVLRGPVCIDRSSRVRAGARILPGTNLGPKCKVGGEVGNAIFLANSNKQHDGYLGDAVIGEWCNLGAGCTSSNLKNDYSEIRLWNYPSRRFLRTGLQFCGLIMGDHSKAGINTMFNTATVVGVGCNIHGAGFPRNFVASFSDGGAHGFVDVIMPKFLETARKVMSRRGVEMTQTDVDILEHIRVITADLK